MTIICPNCGFKHADETFAAELQNLVFLLPLKEKDVLVRLVKARGGWVSQEALFHYVYSGEGGDGPLTTTLYCHVSKLRKKIVRLGWTIANQKFEGYRLLKVQP